MRFPTYKNNSCEPTAPQGTHSEVRSIPEASGEIRGTRSQQYLSQVVGPSAAGEQCAIVLICAVQLYTSDNMAI